jgi:hypothetical protein
MLKAVKMSSMLIKLLVFLKCQANQNKQTKISV